MPDQEDEPKLVVDTDWKDQVAKEKEALAAEEDTVDSEAESGVSQSETGDVASDDGAERAAPPPASFEVLVTMLFSQAMAMLGQFPDPTSGEVTINKPFAKHHIDTLEMLGEKTSGNLSDDESRVLSEALHALRMTFVNTKGP